MDNPLKNIPPRTQKPRNAGVTMVMDKGLSVREAEDFLSVGGEHTDVIKLGWNTSLVTPNLDKKLAVYREAGMAYYFGGTMFEAFYIRNQMDDYKRLLEKFKVPYVEVSDGCVDMKTDVKLAFIEDFSRNYTVLSEVGSKDAEKTLAPYQWVKMMNEELKAGSWKVIAEARESGTVGVFSESGQAKQGLVDEILHYVDNDNLLWEAPQKSQQVWFIQKMGSNVNLGNIAPAEVIPVETLRMGLRGDTFFTFLK